MDLLHLIMAVVIVILFFGKRAWVQRAQDTLDLVEIQQKHWDESIKLGKEVGDYADFWHERYVELREWVEENHEPWRDAKLPEPPPKNSNRLDQYFDD